MNNKEMAAWAERFKVQIARIPLADKSVHIIAESEKTLRKAMVKAKRMKARLERKAAQEKKRLDREAYEWASLGY